MRHEKLAQRKARSSLFTRRRFQLAGALLMAAVLPYFLRYFNLQDFRVQELSRSNALVGNVAAVILAMWMRLSIETYPGIRSTNVILSATVAGHLIVVLYFFLTQLGYDRLGLTLGFVFHVVWN